jgi:hypothetical protein
LNKKQLIVAWGMLVFLTVVISGCAVIGTAISAGISYAIYQATK